MKEKGFDCQHLFEEGVVSSNYDYRSLFDRTLRKRGKDSLKDKEFYLYRIKEIDDDTCYVYPLTHTGRLSKETFLFHLESVRKELVKEKGVKPIIGIDLANRLCERFSYQPIFIEATAVWDKESHDIKEGKNQFGFVVKAAETLDFEKDYPYRRSPDETYLIEGNPMEKVRYFSESYVTDEKPRLIQIEKTWCAYHEYSLANYRSKIQRDDVKIITIENQYSRHYNLCEREDKKYAQRIKKALQNSVTLQETIDLRK